MAVVKKGKMLFRGSIMGTIMIPLTENFQPKWIFRLVVFIRVAVALECRYH
jgi:hypothetical protein